MMKRPFGEFFGAWMRPFSEFLGPWKTEFEPFTMRETEHGFVVSATVPGFKETEVEVSVEPWRVYVHAQHEEASKKGEPVFEEHREFSRWIEFPAEVSPEKAKAVLSKGVLEVTVEKAQAAKRVEVQPKAA
jgi:HSP20 family protein